jgi:hypothetical protein
LRVTQAQERKRDERDQEMSRPIEISRHGQFLDISR